MPAGGYYSETIVSITPDEESGEVTSPVLAQVERAKREAERAARDGNHGGRARTRTADLLRVKQAL